MSKEISNTTFQKSIVHYYNELKKGYLEKLEKASDKEYAKNHWQKVFFTENEYVPYKSVLFNELKFIYHHHNCLDAETAYNKTLELIPQVRIIAEKRKNDAIAVLQGNKTIDIADWYLEQIETGSATLNELILIEEKVLAASNENLIGSLAMHLAGQRLHKEFNQDDYVVAKSNPKHKYEFTRKEQLLALYFLKKSMGINLAQNNDRTKIAAFYHLIMGVPFSDYAKIKNLSIYSSLGVVPQVVDKDKVLLKYLQNIRPFFNDLSLTIAVELIDKQIEMCNSESK